MPPLSYSSIHFTIDPVAYAELVGLYVELLVLGFI